MATPTYDQDLMRKRAVELQSQWQTKEQVSNTLNIEKNLWYFSGKTAPTAPTTTTTPKPTTPPSTKQTQTSWFMWTPVNKNPTPTTPTTPKLSRVDRLAKQNAHIVAQQQPSTPPAPINPTPQITQTTPWYQWTKPENEPMDAWSYGMQEIQKQWQVHQDQIMKQYNDDIATIRLEEDQTKARYKNADQVLSWIRAVEDAYKRGIFDPQQIASQTGIPLDQVNQVLRWEAFKALELQDRATEEDRRDMQYKMDQLQTTKSRSVDDLADQAERSKYNYDNQVDDMMRQAWLATAQMNKVGALTGAVQSSGYRMAIDMVRSEAKRWLDRLKTVQWWEQDDIAKARTRLLEDFENNTMQIKDYFDRGMNTLRMNGMAQIQQVNQKYWVASQNTVNALKQLYNDMEAQKVSLLNETMQLQQSFNGMWTQEIWILEERAKWWLGDRNKDIETYNEIYKTNPALANSLFPELANQVNKTNFENFDMNVDFTSIPWFAEKYPNEARAKNNNPTWIKQPSAQLAQARKDAWIQFSKWTQPPLNENQANPYTKFATIGDGMKAHWIALSRQWGDINKRLQSWVWTSNWPAYAREVMWEAGIPQGTTFEQLTPEQIQSLKMAHINRESPWFYKFIVSSWAWATETPWMPGLTPQISWEAQSVIDGMVAIKDLPSAERVRVLQEIQGAWKQILSTKLVTNAKKSIDLINEILVSPWFAGAVWRSWEKWWWLSKSPLIWTPAFDTWKKIESLKSLIAIPYLENMKWLGAMSEKEFTAMKDASSAMDERMTETAFKQEMAKITEAMNTMITRNGWEAYKPTQQAQRSPKSSWFVIDPNK